MLRFRHVHTQVPFEGLDGPFGLAISLLMVGSRHVKTCAETLEEFCPEHACETGVSVRDDELGKTIASGNTLKKYQGELGGEQEVLQGTKTAVLLKDQQRRQWYRCRTWFWEGW